MSAGPMTRNDHERMACSKLMQRHRDVLSASLDGSIIRVGTGVWRVHASRERVDAYRWVQVVLRGDSRYLIMLKMAPSARAHDAVHAIQWWLANPGHEDGDVIEVD